MIKNKGVIVVNNGVIKVVLIEDDDFECEKYKIALENRKDIKLIGITNSSKEGLKYVKNYKPDGVILDLELNNGEGSGFDFISGIKKLNIDKMPKIVVTTNIFSDSVYNFLHMNKIDFIFYKSQRNFSIENVLNTMVLLKEYDSSNRAMVNNDNSNNDDDKIDELINKELDLIGVAAHLKGRKYLFDSIYLVIRNCESGNNESVIQYLVSKYKRSSSTISRAMQNSILHAWRISALEDLTALYTARINYETGVPTPTEFIYYYADKIKKMI